MDFDSRFGRLIWVMELNLIDMQPIEEDIRAFLIAEAFRFIERVATLEGISRIAMLGSILSSKPNPKDVDLLVTLDDTVDLIVLAKWARSLMGMAQSKSMGADVFLANQTGEYIGRVCQWSRCGPRFRTRCDARSCGVREYLHDDLDDITLDSHLIKEPPLVIWPSVIYRQSVASDLLPFLARYDLHSNEP